MAVCIAVGVLAARMLIGNDEQQPLAFEVGGCVQLTDSAGVAAPCDGEAHARLTAITNTPTECPPSPVGHLDLGDDRFACLEPITTGMPSPEE